MPTFNIHAAKTQLSRLVEDASRGEEVVIAKAGKPLVKLVPVNQSAPRQFGGLRHLPPVPDDFDDPLPPDVLASFHRLIER
jgi:prevent-host-death family protein